MINFETFYNYILIDYTNKENELNGMLSLINQQLYKTLILFVQQFLLTMTQFIYSIEQKSLKPSIASFQMVLLIFNLLIMYNLVSIIKNINTNNTNNITYKISTIQYIVIILFFSYTSIFLLSLNSKSSNIDLILYFISAMLIIENIISIQLKISFQIMKILIIIYYHYQFNQNAEIYIQYAIIYPFILIKVIQRLINHSFTIKHYKESQYQIQTNYETVHDIRNQLYSCFQIESEKLIVYNKNDQIYDKVHDKESGIDYQNNENDNDEINEKCLKKIIMFKISQLYNLQLLYQNSYHIKSKSINAQNLIQNINKTLKSLFVNKNMTLTIEAKCHTDNINIDPKMQSLFLYELINNLHSIKLDPIILQMKFLKNDQNDLIIIWIKNYDHNVAQQIQRNQLLNKLIKSLSLNSQQEYYYDFNNFRIKINLSPPKEQKLKMIPQYRYSCISTNDSQSNIRNQCDQIQQSYNDNSNSQDIDQDNQTDNIKQHDEVYYICQKRNSQIHNSSNQDFFKSSMKIQINEVEDVYEKSNEDYIQMGTEEQNPKIYKNQHKFEYINSMNSCRDSEVKQNSLGYHNSRKKTELTPRKSSTFSVSKENENPSLKKRRQSVDQTDQNLNHSKIKSICKITKEISIFKKDNRCSSIKKNRAMSLPLNIDFSTDYLERNTNSIWINTDDEEHILKMNKRVLGKFEIRLLCTHDLQELVYALNAIHSHTWDDIHNQQSFKRFPSIIILMDHNLDGEKGWQLIQETKKLNSALNLNIRFILLSSTEDSETINIYNKLGVSDTVCKPLTINKFEGMYKNIMSGENSTVNSSKTKKFKKIK